MLQNYYVIWDQQNLSRIKIELGSVNEVVFILVVKFSLCAQQ